MFSLLGTYKRTELGYCLASSLLKERRFMCVSMTALWDSSFEEYVSFCGVEILWKCRYGFDTNQLYCFLILYPLSVIFLLFDLSFLLLLRLLCFHLHFLFLTYWPAFSNCKRCWHVPKTFQPLIKYTTCVLYILLFLVLFPRQRHSNNSFCVFVIYFQHMLVLLMRKVK